MSELDQMVDEFLQLKTNSNVENQGEEALIKTLSKRIAQLLASDFESLMSMMYRLDIEESKIRAALAPENLEDPSTSLARIIVERQKMRMYTKSKYKQPPMNDFIDFD